MNSVVAAVSVVCNIALNVVLIPRYGIEGAAWASTGSYSLLFVVTTTVYRRVARVPLSVLVVPSREDGARYMRLVKRAVGRAADKPPAEPGLAWGSRQESVTADAGSWKRR